MYIPKEPLTQEQFDNLTIKDRADLGVEGLNLDEANTAISILRKAKESEKAAPAKKAKKASK